ncbi:hypothetical protein ACAG24_009750 [Mycobacterium sp. pW049]|uniref:DUF7689 domain-containing protein n=1 Tax=[Mycobacterium] bulgaricum TaxID=3238985 RepID=UPI00351AE256
MTSTELEEIVPVLRYANYEVTSPVDDGYNCAAWAVGDNVRFWDPSPIGAYHWPDGLPRDRSTATYILAFETVGFSVGGDASLEAGIEKIAIYGLNGQFQHAARQLADGRWASKCGEKEDIIHSHPYELEGDELGYGAVVAIMRRSLTGAAR